MPLDFPTSPTLNEIYTFGGRSWQWNGTAWDVYSAVSGNVVTQLNGLTGGVTLAAGSNITLTPSGNTITIASSGGGGSGISGPYVISFNGLTGAVTGVSSVRGLTGGVGITNGSGIGLSVSGQTLTFSNTGVLSIDGGTGAITNVARTNVDNNFSTNQTISAGDDSRLVVFDVTNSTQIDLATGSTPHIFSTDSNGDSSLYFTYDGSNSIIVNIPNYNTTLAGLAGTQTFTGTNTFNTLTNFPGGISAAGATFTGNISAPNIVNSINGKTGATNLVAGSGITLALSGNTFTISSTATSGGGTYYNFTQSSSAPAGPTAGDRWFDTNTGKFFTSITDSGSNIWIESGGIGNGQAGLTASIDFSETINYLKLRVTGLGNDFSTSLSIFDTQVKFFETVSISTISTPNVISISEIVEYDAKSIDGQWVVDITAKPPFGNNLTAEQLTNETFSELYVAWNPSGLLLIEDYWYTFTNVEILEKQATYVVKGITGQSWVAADSFITCKVMGLTSADHTAEDAIVEGVQFEINNITPGVGFDIMGYAPEGTYGKYTIKCLGQ